MTMTWAEDRATQRCDPSAAPGAKTGARAGLSPGPAPSLLRDWHESDKPSRQECRDRVAGCHFQPANPHVLDSISR